MHGNSEVPMSSAVFTAFKLMVDNLSHEEGSVFAVEAESYLKGKFPNAVSSGTGNPVCKRQASICPQKNQIQRIMEESNNFNLAVDLNNMIQAFNNLYVCFEMHGAVEIYAKKCAEGICKFGVEINSGRAQHIYDDEKPELSKQYVQWKAAIKNLCDGCINFRFSDTSNTMAEAGDSKLNRFLDKLCQICPDQSKSINSLKHAIKQNYYDHRSKASLSKLVLERFIGSGDVKIFSDTLQALLEFHDFVPENALASISPQQAASIQAAAAAKSIFSF